MRSQHRVVDEVAPVTVGASAMQSKCPAELSLVLGMALDGTQLVGAMRKLAARTVATAPCLHPRAAQLGLQQEQRQ